ncbi:hypothetical protein F0Q45_23470 [Mycobacterium simiae]|uniref:Uncharacterized protein n=1 Tax=Mycobacterium simiae TaxID=1784 RepID=A0A5B1BCX5_MYCSI|nr:hypothetical protein [Mycobacterium simiae]KAA1246246.1 hypothetical protein F0Q45_23470 [Mycobacterium simiae]
MKYRFGPTAPCGALQDGADRITATAAVERERLGVSGNMAGMAGKTTTLLADTVFRPCADLCSSRLRCR